MSAEAEERGLKATAFERRRAFLLGSRDTMSWLPADVTVYKEDLHKAPQGPLRGEVFAWQYVPFPETSENPEIGVGLSRIPPAPNPDSREKLW